MTERRAAAMDSIMRSLAEVKLSVSKYEGQSVTMMDVEDRHGERLFGIRLTDLPEGVRQHLTRHMDRRPDWTMANVVVPYGECSAGKKAVSDFQSALRSALAPYAAPEENEVYVLSAALGRAIAGDPTTAADRIAEALVRVLPADAFSSVLEAVQGVAPGDAPSEAPRR